MGLISWVLVGAIAGWIASKFTGNDARMGAFANIVAGIVGAFIGGIVLNFFGIDGVTGFNLWSIIVATLGAVILLFIINRIRS